MFSVKKNNEMNMCEGPLLKKIILFAIPLFATNILQVLFNTADSAVLGQFVSDRAVASVGSTVTLVNLIIGLFVGLSVGANVLVARYKGENNMESARKTVGMSMILSVITGTVLIFIGQFFSRTFLEWMGCPDELIDMATKYMKIYFIGMPILMLYNFCASILRAVGDTLRPLIFLMIGGVANILMNILFVVVFHKDVEGVAVATVTSQGISVVLSIITLLKSKDTDFCKLETKYLRFYKKELWELIKIGVPSGLQGCIFSIANVLIQSSINSFGDVVVTGNTVAAQIDIYIYNAMYAVALSSLAFVSQNLGAGKIDRIKTVVRDCVFLAFGIGIVFSSVAVIFHNPLFHIFTTSPDVIEIAWKRLLIVGAPYFLCGIMDVMANSMRGLGKSTFAMVISLSGSCLFRILWLNTVFVKWHTYETVMIVYPVSYILTISIYFVVFGVYYKKLKKQYKKKGDSVENQLRNQDAGANLEIDG